MTSMLFLKEKLQTSCHKGKTGAQRMMFKNRDKNFFKFQNMLAFICILIPFVFIVCIWSPIIATYFVKIPQINDDIIVQSIQYPQSDTAEKIERLTLGAPDLNMNNKEILSSADSILKGKIKLPGYPVVSIQLPFDKNLIHSDVPGLPFIYCRFIVPKILIQAYDISKDDKYLIAACDFISGWSNYENSQLIPKSLVWNDHTIASRALILSDFWYRYKNHKTFKKKEAKIILKLAYKLTNLLAKDKLYTYQTNHGTMQNLALLKMSFYFPELEKMMIFRSKALKRIEEQLYLFVNDEGVVLEHSPGYHKFGVDLMDAISFFYNESNIKYPEALFQRGKKAEKLLKTFKRPDDSLPGIGDTFVGSKNFVGDIKNQKKDKDVTDFTLLPKAGYAIWNINHNYGENFSQAAITWSYYPYMGHKHPDELSINLWSNGINWCTGVGYWPYSDENRNQAVNWSGSNAPHLTGEPFNSKRISWLVSYAKSDELNYINLLRKNDDGFQVNRQIVHIKPNKWLILDSFSDNANRTVNTVWTAGENISIRRGKEENLYEYVHKISYDKLHVKHIFSSDAKIKILSGSKQPFAGWISSEKGILPVDSIFVQQSSQNTWAATVSILEVTGQNITFQNESKIQKWDSAENWNAIFSDGTTIELNKDVFTLNENIKVPLAYISLYDQSHLETDKVYRSLHEKYKIKFSPLINFKKKVTYLILVCLFLIQLSGYFIKKKIKRFISYFNILSSLFWLTSICLYVLKISFIMNEIHP